MEQVACPVRPDKTFANPIELVFMLSHNYTVGTSKATAPVALEMVRHELFGYGEVVSYFCLPDWQVRDIALFPQGAESGSIPEKLTKLQTLGEPLRLVILDPSRSDFEYELTLRTDRNDLCGTEVDFIEEPDWWLKWQIIGALVSGAVDRGDPKGRDELLEAARIGLDEVLDVRIRQLELVEA